MEARVVDASAGEWAAGQRALDRLHELAAGLPPFDAVQAAAEVRLELDQWPRGLSVVVDANVLIVDPTGDRRRAVAEAAQRAALVQNEPLHTPALSPRRWPAGGRCRRAPAGEVWRSLAALPMTLQPVADRVLRWSPSPAVSSIRLLAG